MKKEDSTQVGLLGSDSDDDVPIGQRKSGAAAARKPAACKKEEDGP
ncbi:hypothetical protein HaLaN_31427, partial [Haematococcus lacustris]